MAAQYTEPTLHFKRKASIRFHELPSKIRQSLSVRPAPAPRNRDSSLAGT